jgi:hypothetical protein
MARRAMSTGKAVLFYGINAESAEKWLAHAVGWVIADGDQI